MIKHAIFPGKNDFGSPHIHLVEPGSAYGLDKTASLEKTASREHLPEVQELLESIAPQPGRLYLVNSALGAGEVVGFNLRGDWFTEAGLTREPPGWKDIPVWDIDARRKAANITTNLGPWGDLTWGYPTFYNAHRFRHHVNKDPNKAYGFILGAFWDDRMKRVVLVSELVEDMCRKLGALDLYQRIQAGEFPDSSMGSKVPYDRCSICGNKARNPAQYCEHVGAQALPPYGMKSLLPDGRRCGVYNDYPRFFDDSFVFTGAERSAKVMANVTGDISGSNPYTQNIYPFTPAVSIKLADSSLDAAVTDAQKHDPTTESRIEIAVRQIPVASPQEKAALRYYADIIRAGQKVKDGVMSKEEFLHLNMVHKQQFQTMNGAPVDNFAYIRDQLFAAVKTMVNATKDTQTYEKQAFAKWADIFKSIPADPKLLSLARSQTKGMRPIPDEVLSTVSENPEVGLGQLARLGIVLKPDEFQKVMLPSMGPSIMPTVIHRKIIFRSRPLSAGVPEFNIQPASSVPESIMSALSDILENRSFSPKAVRIRIMKVEEPVMQGPLQEVSDPILDKIGELYNAYRNFLLKNRKNVDDTVVKLANFSDIAKDMEVQQQAAAVSDIMFSTAYWPFTENVLQ